MRLPSKPTYAFLLFLCVINLAIRYPRTPHELGYDGFIYHGMTVSLVQNGYALWILHPLSYFGLYPLSQPSGSLFFLAGLNELGGMEVEASILIFDFGLVFLGLLGSFILSMEIRRDEPLALTVAALFSLSPRLVSGLLWEIPTRTLFSALVPIFLWALLRFHRGRDARSLTFGLVVLALMMSAHRLAVMMSAVVVAFILTEVVLVAVRTLRIRYASLVLRSRFRRSANIAVLVGFFAITISLMTAGGILAGYGERRIPDSRRTGGGGGCVPSAIQAI